MKLWGTTFRVAYVNPQLDKLESLNSGRGYWRLKEQTLVFCALLRVIYVSILWKVAGLAVLIIAVLVGFLTIHIFGGFLRHEVHSEETDLASFQVFENDSWHVITDLLQANDFVNFFQVAKVELVFGNIYSHKVTVLLSMYLCWNFIVLTDFSITHIHITEGVTISQQNMTLQEVEHLIRF
jgi:hypothetical protein